MTSMTLHPIDDEPDAERWLFIMWGHARIEAMKLRITGAVAWAPCWLHTPRLEV